MAFFDDLSKKISDAGYKTIAKTKEMSEVSKLNAYVGGEQKKLKELYMQLGERYAQLHRDDYEDAFVDIMGSLFECEVRIADYQQQIRDAKGVSICQQCGAEVGKGFAFCSACGAAMPVAEPAPMDGNVCTSCGTPLAPDVRFCTTCGTPVAAPAPAAAPAPVYSEPVAAPAYAAPPAQTPAYAMPTAEPAVTQPVAPAPAVAQTPAYAMPAETPAYAIPATDLPATPAAPVAEGERACPNCGSMMGSGKLFCTECGTKLQ